MKILGALLLILFAAALPLLAAESAHDTELFLRNKMMEIKGEVPTSKATSEFHPPECGTSVALAIYVASRKDAEYATLLTLLQRPNLPDTFGTTHFLIHYTTTGPDSVYQPNTDSIPSIPQYVTRVASVLDNVWSIEIDSLSYNSPLSDSGQGGDNRYDVYLMNLGFGYFGFTTPESIPNYGYRASSYMVLENDFAESQRYRNNPYDGVKITAAHEFFHAVQFAYDLFEFDFSDPNNPLTYKPWWMEASAVWMEDAVYTDINDYIGYLPFFYKYIWMGLGTFSYGGDPRAFHPYASVVWPIFMTEKYSNLDIIRQIWAICGQVPGYNTLPATNAVLGQFGTTLQNAFLEFEVWNFHTGIFADPWHFYHEGSLYPVAETTAYISDLSSLPSYPINGLPNPPEDLAMNYIILRSLGVPGGVEVDFDGQDLTNAEWHVAILGYRDGDSRWADMHVDPFSGFGENTWPDCV